MPPGTVDYAAGYGESMKNAAEFGIIPYDQKVIYEKPQEGVEAHAREKVPDKG